MARKPRYRSWTRFLTGGFISLAVVTPALALPPDLPVEVHGDMQLYALAGFGLLLVAALVMRTMKTPESTTTADEPARYSTRFFPGDRPIALE